MRATHHIEEESPRARISPPKSLGHDSDIRQLSISETNHEGVRTNNPANTKSAKFILTLGGNEFNGFRGYQGKNVLSNQRKNCRQFNILVQNLPCAFMVMILS